MSTSNYNNSKGKCDKPLCTHCGILGHTIDKCDKKHRYPLGFKPKWRGSEQYKRQSSQLKLVTNQTGMVFKQNDDFMFNNSVTTLTANQCQQLISLLSSQLQRASQIVNDQQPSVSNFTGTSTLIPGNA
ncbi:hypothetical protein Dsin_009581 [Dipteronia sinensis]|uniref:Uncharacterized protein n=1 Tax=Dipteronia sinensis TaxID=43782 RepID=A0AAE0AQX6_9ROSI|nr:hypothetical protein Dsin_009581 [Dipteronia sinensis]